MGTQRKNTTRRECAATVTINSGGTRSPGIVLMINSTLTECAKTAILTVTTRKGERRRRKRKMRRSPPVSSRENRTLD